MQTHFPILRDKKILKTDLWDEAKNSQILFWAFAQGAETHGIDISLEIAREARQLLPGGRHPRGKVGFVVSDLRSLAVADEAFDYVYSMGTIEHFAESEQALRECRRVLKKGGLAVIGVPNRWDPFLRPLLVAFLNSLHLYSYGFEKSFSMKSLEKMVRKAGFEVVARSGILFFPGWLRMIDLYVHTRWPRASFLMEPTVRPFAYLYKKIPWLRRYGYLIACICRKP